MAHDDSSLQQHYRLLLGIGDPWEVEDVKLDLAGKSVEIRLRWASGAKGECPECGGACSVHDFAAVRTWRHLDPMHFHTNLRACRHREDCRTHGGKTYVV